MSEITNQEIPPQSPSAKGQWLQHRRGSLFLQKMEAKISSKLNYLGLRWLLDRFAVAPITSTETLLEAYKEQLRWVEKTFEEMRKVDQCPDEMKTVEKNLLRWHVRRDGVRWEELRWGEMRWEELTWFEMRWSVECEVQVWSVKCGLWRAQCEV